MKSCTFKVESSLEGTLERLRDTLQQEPLDTIFRMSAPVVYDRLIGTVKENNFQARLYSGQVSSDSVIANGHIEPHGKRITTVHVDFEWGAEAQRTLTYISSVAGLLLFPLGILAWPMFLIGGIPLFYGGYKLAMRSFERKCICDCLSKGLKSETGA